jgi:hypothetical protein
MTKLDPEQIRSLQEALAAAKTEVEKDVILYGVGFTVDGVRVVPTRVVVHHGYDITVEHGLRYALPAEEATHDPV